MNRAWAAALCVTMPLTAQAQQQQRACVFDTAAHRDTVAHVLSVIVLRGGDTVPDHRLSHAVGTMLREHFRAPPSIGALFYPYVIGPLDKATPLPSTLESSTYGSFGFSIHRDGTLGEIRLLATTGDSATDVEIIRDLQAASDSGEGAYLNGTLRDSDDQLRLLVTSGGGGGAEPLIRLRVPTIHAEAWATIRRAKAVKYPPDALRARIPGVVELAFIIDETGHAVPNSIRLLFAPYQEFAESATEAILAERFGAARAGGCPVKMRVLQQVRYTSNER